MNILIENGIISEMKCGNDFSYILNDNSLFLSTEYKVLQGQEKGYFIKCMKVLFNGKIQFYYLTNGYRPLANMIPNLDADSFMTIITNVFSSVLAVKQNGFLSCQNIDITIEKIFVEPNTYKAALIYLPISKRFYPDESTFENELRTSLIKLISGVSTLSSAKTLQFKADLSNGMLSIKDLYDRIKGGKAFKIDSEPVAESWKRDGAKLLIVAKNAPMRVEIEVTKDNFVIGKNAAAVDGVISFNKMISRVHCQITKENGKYLLTDLKSANGTYINNVRLIPNKSYPIRNGDIVRLANSDFQVEVL